MTVPTWMKQDELDVLPEPEEVEVVEEDGLRKASGAARRGRPGAQRAEEERPSLLSWA